jgi:hypothetical protein
MTTISEELRHQTVFAVYYVDEVHLPLLEDPAFVEHIERTLCQEIGQEIGKKIKTTERPSNIKGARMFQMEAVVLTPQEVADLIARARLEEAVVLLAAFTGDKA